MTVTLHFAGDVTDLPTLTAVALALADFLFISPGRVVLHAATAASVRPTYHLHTEDAVTAQQLASRLTSASLVELNAALGVSLQVMRVTEK